MTNTESYVDEAESVIKELKNARGNNGKPLPMITTSQIRNILAMTAEIYNDVRINGLDEKILERVAYLRMRCVYEAGRNQSVKAFIEKSDILKKLKGVKTKDHFIAFSHYMEALVAWHKYNGGKD